MLTCLPTKAGQGLEYKKSIKSSNANKGTQGSKSSTMRLPNLAFLCGLCDTAFLLAFVSQSSQGASRFAKSVWNAGGLSPKIIFYFQPLTCLPAGRQVRISYLSVQFQMNRFFIIPHGQYALFGLIYHTFPSA